MFLRCDEDKFNQGYVFEFDDHQIHMKMDDVDVEISKLDHFDFSEEYLAEICYYCLVMSQGYIEQHFSDIKEHADAIEQRMDDTGCTMNSVIEENAYYFEMCLKHECNYILIDDCYNVEIDL